MKFYFKPITKLGFSYWLAFAVDGAGAVVWSVTAASEQGARAACLKQQAKGV